jgi:myo-inositol-1(or 4)-monophosphatase|nr:inositol monophosphatase [Aeromicrobium sp.]
MTDPLYELAREVGLEAAAFVRSSRPEGRVDVASTKSSDTDLVTEIDRSCELLIRERIFAARPDDGFVGEEGADVIGTSGVDWVVDPIDGTVNFVHGIPSYAVAIAARRDGTVVVGHVVNIATGAEWGAERGAGSWRHDGERRHPLTAPKGAPLARAVMATGFHYTPDIRAKQAAAMATFLPQIADIRRTGSAALNLCALAEGQCDAYFEQGLHLWDHAAAGLVATEAGLVVTGLHGEPDERMLMAAHPAVAAEYFGLVHACGF